jgi:UDP-glucose 4-epimerase
VAGRQKEHRCANLISGRRVAVTGGAGFIGSHLVEELAPHNEVIIIDNLSAGRLENVAPFLKVPGVSFLRGSVTDLPFLQEAFRNVDYVFHQAALTSVPESVAGPLAADEINVRGTLNVLLAARDCKVKKVVYASSCAVYGNSPGTFPQKEDQLPGPLSPYAASKLAGELYCRIFSETYGLPTAVLRYFNVYGPRQNPDSPYAAVIPVFIKRTLAGLPPVIHGDGNQMRDFIFVKDVVRANLLAAAGDFSGPVNIGTGTATAVRKLAGMIAALAGGDRLQPVYAPPRPADPRVSRADTKRARNLGFKPRYTLAEGLALTWQSFAAAAGRQAPGKTPGERT